MYAPKGNSKDTVPGPHRNLSPEEARIKAHIQSNGGTIADASKYIRKENAKSKTLWERYSSGAKPSIPPSKHCRISKVIVTDDPKLVADKWIQTYRNQMCYIEPVDTEMAHAHKKLCKEYTS